MPTGTLTFDIETLDADLLYTTPPEKFVRLIGYRWRGEREVTVTTDLDEIREQIMQAETVVGHNIHSFDLPAVFGVYSDIPLELAMEGRVYDTWTHAVLVHPAPYQYTNRFGKTAFARKPEEMKKWFSLDEQAFQLGVPGKTHDLKELAAEFGDPDLPLKQRIKDGFGKIPVDDPRYVEYLKGDVIASDHVADALLKLGELDDYALREQEIEARKAVIQANGFRVDIERAKARVRELAERREQIMTMLAEKYAFPTDGDSPWDTIEGKRAILAALADHGITPDTVDWPKTPVWEKRDEHLKKTKEKIKELREKVKVWKAELKSGELPARSIAARERWIESATREIQEKKENPFPPGWGLSFSGDTLVEITRDTPAADIGTALAELKGQRSLAQLALECTHSDGFVHPEITMLQRSGRWSTTKPGLTVWTARGEGAVEKSYFIPDDEDEVLLELDYSNADARIVAALSGDKKYAERFEPGADGHLINAIAAWGAEKVLASEESKAMYRQKGKPLGHGWSYGGRPKTLSQQAGVPLEDAIQFCRGMDTAFHVLVAWQNRVRKAAQRGFIVNEWGRKMWIEKGREYTQAPALLGQSGTREIMCDALLRMPIHVLRCVKAQIHDALVLSVPRASAEKWKKYLIDLMETEFSPKGGQRIEFPVGCGPAGENWYEAGH